MTTHQQQNLQEVVRQAGFRDIAAAAVAAVAEHSRIRQVAAGRPHEADDGAAINFV